MRSRAARRALSDAHAFARTRACSRACSGLLARIARASRVWRPHAVRAMRAWAGTALPAWVPRARPWDPARGSPGPARARSSAARSGSAIFPSFFFSDRPFLLSGTPRDRVRTMVEEASRTLSQRSVRSRCAGVATPAMGRWPRRPRPSARCSVAAPFRSKGSAVASGLAIVSVGLVSCACQSRGGSWGGETAPGASRWCQHTVGRLSAHSAARPGDVWSPLTVWSVACDAGARREAQTGHGGRSASNSIGNRCGAASYIICRSLLAMKSVPRRYSPDPFTARAPFTRQRPALERPTFRMVT